MEFISRQHNASTPDSLSLASRQSWRRSMCFDTRLSIDLIEALWQKPEGLIAVAEPLRKIGTRSTALLTWNEQPFVIKHYVPPSRRHALKQTIQPSRASRTWSVAHTLAGGGVATPQPVACIENRLGPLFGDSYLVYPYVAGQTLRFHLEQTHRPSSTFLQQVAVQWVECWNRLVQLRISLGDTNLKNFIVGAEGRLWVIDLDNARAHRTEYFAQRRYERGWRQFCRSARRRGNLGERLMSEVEARMGISLSYDRQSVAAPAICQRA